MASLNFRTLDLNLLRVFNEVMTERSLTKAASKLSLTQPAVSNALRRLREVLGDDLLRRSGQGVEPTPRALALWPTVQDALRQLQASLSPDFFVPASAEDAAHDHHEAPLAMLIPLCLTAVISVLIGVFPDLFMHFAQAVLP